MTFKRAHYSLGVSQSSPTQPSGQVQVPLVSQVPLTHEGAQPVSGGYKSRD